jgi:pimeloyl-ACP methyl ester carboxylesterase
MAEYQMRARRHGFAATLHLTVSGRGSVPVVLGNGFGTVLSIWDRLLPWLERRFRVVRFDWPLAPGDFDADRYRTIDGFAEDLLSLVIVADAAPCLYIGHSVAGMAGVVAAQVRPDFFRRLVLLAPSPRYLDDGGYRGGFSPADVSAVVDAMADNFVRWAGNFAPHIVGLPDGRPEVVEFASGLTALRPDIAVTMMRTILLSDLRPRLPGLAVPATIVQPLRDHAVPEAVGRYLHRQWPDSRLELIDTTGHLPHLTAPDKVLAVLEGTLGQDAPTGGSAGTATTKVLPLPGRE